MTGSAEVPIDRPGGRANAEGSSGLSRRALLRAAGATIAGMEQAQEIRVVDKYTVEYVTQRPYRPLLRLLSFQAIMSPKAVSDLGARIATNPVGTGPFRFVEYAPGQHVLMERNPDYWGPAPKFNRLRIRFI